MRRLVFSFFILVLTAHTCPGAIVLPTPEGHVIRLHTAVVDILKTCYGDPGSAVGIVGDSNGLILKVLRSNYVIPVVFLDAAMTMDHLSTTVQPHRLRVFVITTASYEDFYQLMRKLVTSRWWTHYANILIVSSTRGSVQQCSNFHQYLYTAFKNFGVLGAQFICADYTKNVHIFDFNPFTPKAPRTWQFLRSYKTNQTPFSLFKITYQEGGKTCEALRFEKENDLGGYRLDIVMPDGFARSKVTDNFDESITNGESYNTKKLVESYFQQNFFFIDNIVIGMNASIVIYENFNETGIVGDIFPFSATSVYLHDRFIISWNQYSFLAVTQHTLHKSQLEKILSVIDRESRIGMWIVYLITFLFFKFFLRQPVIPALLNLVRLTCNTGLPTMPHTFPPKVYFVSLFMFVITLQAIYTGDLASLLTQTTAYPHVNTIQDIVKLRYKIYGQDGTKNILAADPILDGHEIKIAGNDGCIQYVVLDPLVVCIMEYKAAVISAEVLRLHLSRDTIKNDYGVYLLSRWNPLGRKLEARIRRWDECSLRLADREFAKVHSSLVNDDDVNNNVVRRVMTLNDLMFAFVILAVGLTCSLVCFIGEIIIYRISLRIAKRRDRVRPLSAWGVTENKCSSFSALRLRFNALSLFSNHR